MDACCVVCRLPNGTVDVILAYCHNSINDDSLQDLVPYLKKKGVGIISASPMSMGLLTTKVGLLFALERLQQTILLPNSVVVVLLAYHLLSLMSRFQLLKHLKPFAHTGQALRMTLSRPNELD